MRELVIVGVGPGDPGHLTLGGLEALRRAETVCVPVVRGEEGRAERVVRAHLPDRPLVRLEVDIRHPDRARMWQALARDLLQRTAGVQVVAFATLGDPHLYSTAAPLAAALRTQLPGLRITTVPGVPALAAAAAAAGTMLATGTTPLLVLPATGDLDRLQDALREGTAVVIYKVGARLDAVRDAALVAGRHGWVVTELGGATHVTPLATARGPAPYLTTVLIPEVSR